MAELRQRRGEEPRDDRDEEIRKLQAELQAARAKGEASLEWREDAQRQKMIEEIAKALAVGKPGKVKGLSNNAKQCKDRLAADPFNMELILDLGLAYAEDGQWDKCSNVLLRGWKRVGELEDAGVRYQFLICLAEASQKTRKFRQALAVMNDIEEPDDAAAKAHYELMRCQIYCASGDMQRGLKALSKAMEGQDFDQAAAIWANCLGPLKKVGAYEMSKSTMMGLAGTDEAKAKLEAMEKLAMLRDEFYETGAGTVVVTQGRRVARVAVAVFSCLVLLYLLYLFESASLAKLRPKG